MPTFRTSAASTDKGISPPLMVTATGATTANRARSRTMLFFLGEISATFICKPLLFTEQFVFILSIFN